MATNGAPAATELQAKAASKKFPPVPKVCVVTGGTGFVGQRLVEMLVQRGATKVRSFDIVSKPSGAWDHPAIEWVVGDITDKQAVLDVCKGADCVWHNAAAVGPFHPLDLYERVNHYGTVNIIDACKAHGVPKIVMSSSPSTRFDGTDVDGRTEADLPDLPMDAYMQEYAASKARGEMKMLAACCDSLMTIAVAPHQVYGPRDNLFMPNILEAAGMEKLRIFSLERTGYGKNKVSFTHVDNYAHALIISERALKKGSPALGKFYVVTDGDTHTHSEGYGYFWDEIDKSIVSMGFTSLHDKVKLPYWFLMILAYICDFIGYLLGTKLKLNPFNIKVLTMHRWFNIASATEDLNYTPIIPFDQGWTDTQQWFITNWLPGFKNKSSRSLFGVSKQSLDRIDSQAKKK